jgi:hypothetical protein
MNNSKVSIVFNRDTGFFEPHEFQFPNCSPPPVDRKRHKFEYFMKWSNKYIAPHEPNHLLLVQGESSQEFNLDFSLESSKLNPNITAQPINE